MVSGRTLLALCARRDSTDDVLVVYLDLLDESLEPGGVGEKLIPPTFLAGATTNRGGRVLDAASLGGDRWGIHEEGKGESGRRGKGRKGKGES